MTVALLIVLCVVLTIVLALSVTLNVRHGKVILDVVDAVEEALDVCDATYSRISAVLEMPVAAASPEVRHVLTEIARARDSVLHVSNALAEPLGGIEDGSTEDGV